MLKKIFSSVQTGDGVTPINNLGWAGTNGINKCDPGEVIPTNGTLSTECSVMTSQMLPWPVQMDSESKLTRLSCYHLVLQIEKWESTTSGLNYKVDSTTKWTYYKVDSTTKWNIIYRVFRDDFPDVTLACEDGQQIGTHKVILF